MLGPWAAFEEDDDEGALPLVRCSEIVSRPVATPSKPLVGLLGADLSEFEEDEGAAGAGIGGTAGTDVCGGDAECWCGLFAANAAGADAVEKTLPASEANEEKVSMLETEACDCGKAALHKLSSLGMCAISR